MNKTEALKLALGALELPSMKTQSMLEQRDAAITAVKEALAQPEFLSSNEADIAQLIEERDVREDILDKVLDMVLGIDRPEWSSSYQYIDAVEDVREALAQPERPWVGLTNEEIYKIYRDCGDLNVKINIARAIEAKLKEKNT